MRKGVAIRLVARSDRSPSRDGHILRDYLQRNMLRAQRMNLCRTSMQQGRMSDEQDLASIAGELLAMRRRRDDSLPSRLLGEAAWDILLAAYSSPNAIMQTKELCASSPAPEATTIRWLQVLERSGYLERAVHPIRQDQRATYYKLTPFGRSSVGHALRAMLHE